jgi:energy-coupling factor transporter ATP-binding protein EcfA2
MTMVEDAQHADRLGSVSSGNALELRGVTKMFGALAAIRDVTLTVGSGERRAVLGSNGAGKTTLFNCVTGDFLPTSGTIRLFGEDVTAFPAYERIRRGCGAPTRSAFCSAASPSPTTSISPAGACRAGGSRSCARGERRAARPRGGTDRGGAPDTGRATRWSRTSATASSGSSRSRWRSRARRASSCSTNRRRACRRPSGGSWSRS